MCLPQLATTPTHIACSMATLISGKIVARNCCFVACSMGLGDAICQYAEGHGTSSLRESTPWELDVARTARMMFTGLLVSGPYSTLNHVMMERVFPGSSGQAVIKKILSSTMIAPFSMSLSFTRLRQDDRIHRETVCCGHANDCFE